MATIKLTETHGVWIGVCSNVECVTDGTEVSDVNRPDATAEAVSKARDVMFDELGDFGQTNCNYHDWHGGKWSKADARASHVAANFFSRTVDLDPDEPGGNIYGGWEHCRSADIPADLRNRVEALLDRAADAMSAAIGEYETTKDPTP